MRYAITYTQHGERYRKQTGHLDGHEVVDLMHELRDQGATEVGCEKLNYVPPPRTEDDGKTQR
jgi:hypothetical protein